MRNQGWMTVGGALLIAGCASLGGSKNENKSAALTAQEQATSSLDQATQAQKRAQDEQAKAEEADRKVEQTQKSLAEQQAAARAQHLKAEQAQQEAQKAVQVAQQSASERQQQAVQAQQQLKQQSEEKTQQNQSWMEKHELTGQVLSAADDSVQVRTSDAQVLNLKVSDSTSVLLNGQSASAKQLTPGSDVRASYQLVDGQPRAVRIEATTSAK